MVKEFLQEVANFKLWAKTADQSYGEWETEYHHWDKINLATDKLVDNVPVGGWVAELLDCFLYILARDNECENIIDTLIQYPEQLLAISRHAVTFEDSDARWQIAFGLGKINVDTDEIHTLLKSFLADEDEYVRRRAALAWEERGL